MRLPWFKFTYEFTPSSELADLAIGDLFNITGKGKKRWMLVSRDPWKAHIVRYTKLDALCERLGRWYRSKRSKG